MRLQDGGSVFGMDVRIDIDARQQLTALACASLVPRCASSSSSWARLLPVPILADLLGPTWVLRPARPIIIRESSFGRSREDVLFVVSHTLGVIGRPVVVEPLPWLFCGWLGSHNVLEQKPGDPGGYSELRVFDTGSRKHLALLMREYSEGVDRPEFMCCCNLRWAVALTNRRKKLHVWKVVDSVPQLPELCAFDCPWIDKPFGLRFFGSHSEYDYNQCDEIEILFTREKRDPTERRGVSEFICVLNLNLADSTAIHSSLENGLLPLDAVIECKNTTSSKYPFPHKPLVRRSDRSYHFLHSTPGIRRPKVHQFLHLSTGLTTPWRTHNVTVAVSTVDESHLALTASDHGTTTVYDPLSTTNPLVPCYVHHHPPATMRVAVGCGLVVSDSSVHRTTAEDTVNRHQTQHSFNDAVSGVRILTMWHDGVVPICNVRAVPFTTNFQF
ncbi:hypothetical protein Pelo_9428 [Pelomyxa schiedti]|nr:hypothetical protein Pelo_9428 [Pelomyxa schiedti]